MQNPVVVLQKLLDNPDLLDDHDLAHWDMYWLFVLMMLIILITVLIVMLANAKKLNGENEELDGQTERPSNVSSILIF